MRIETNLSMANQLHVGCIDHREIVTLCVRNVEPCRACRCGLAGVCAIIPVGQDDRGQQTNRNDCHSSIDPSSHSLHSFRLVLAGFNVTTPVRLVQADGSSLCSYRTCAQIEGSSRSLDPAVLSSTLIPSRVVTWVSS